MRYQSFMADTPAELAWIALLGTAILVSRGSSEYGDANARTPKPSVAEIPPDSGLLDARYRDPDSGSKVVYRVRRLPFGMSIAYAAGTVSGLLGIGGGFIKVP